MKKEYVSPEIEMISVSATECDPVGSIPDPNDCGNVSPTMTLS